MKSASTAYRAYISRVGETDLISDEFVSTQPTLGSLFKSQNASTWEPSQWEDLKFILYRAEFSRRGNLQLYNPALAAGNGQVPVLLPNSINPTSRSVRIGIGKTLAGGSANLDFGTNITQTGSNASGRLIGFAGIATDSISVVNAGLGYTNGTFTGIAFTNITGTGRDATGIVTVANNIVTGVHISGGGSGYKVGDVLGVNAFKSGRNARFSVVSIASTNELILDNVQGTFSVGAGNTMLLSLIHI